MTLTYDLYWSFRSPYSYFLMSRLTQLEREYDVRGRIRPVYPLAVRTPEFFTTRDPLWFGYFMRDIQREAEFLGLPFRWPRPDPVLMDRASGTYPTEQPHIYRLTRMGAAAVERGCGLQFLDEASHVIWSGSVDNWHEGDHLARAAARAGLDPAELARTVEREGARLDALIRENQADQRKAGHYGVPLLVFEDEPFFGQDRFGQFKWRLEQQGLARRRLQTTG